MALYEMLLGADVPEASPATYLAGAAALIGAVAAAYGVFTKGRRQKYKTRAAIVAVGVLVLTLSLAYLVTRDEDDGEGANQTTTNGTTTTGSSTSYRQKVGATCDDLGGIDEERSAAESDLDATGLVSAWKDYIGEEIEFSDLSPPAALTEMHSDVDERWKRHAALLRTLTNRVNDNRDPEAMKKVLDGQMGKRDDRLRREVADKLADLAGSACKYEPSDV